MKSDVIVAAQQAVANGLSVVPPQQDGTKAPRGKWKDYQKRHPTKDELNAWYTNPNTTGIGIVCGKISGNLEMLEFEGRALDLLTEYEQAADQAGLSDLWNQIVEGYSEVTPSGGWHFLYKCSEPIEGNLKLARNQNHEPLIETRGEGGYTICAPTSGDVHPTGKPWTLIDGGFNTIITITPQQRAELHRIAKTFDQTPPQTLPQPATEINGDRPGDLYNQSPQAQQNTLELLIKHGWTHVYTDSKGHKLRRPDKKQGISATLGYPDGNSGLLYVYSTSTEFEPEKGYTPFAVLTQLEHNSNYTEAATALANAGHTTHTLDLTTLTQPDTPNHGIQFLDLYELFTGDHQTEHWLAWPIIPKGRQTAIYASGKTGKSLLTLDIACALATSSDLLGKPNPHPPTHILYTDFEMTPADLQERLYALGYTETDPSFTLLQTHLHYALLQPWHPFDTPEGGKQITEICKTHGIELVIIDTLIRSVVGEENTADTIKNFNRYTGQQLKAADITVLRIDHSGKDTKKGARGTSAKRDDVDLIWELKETDVKGKDITLVLNNKASRMNWVAQKETIIRTVDDDQLTHTIGRQHGISDKGATLWNTFYKAGAPHPLTRVAARDLMKEMGVKGNNVALGEALEWWNRDPDHAPDQITAHPDQKTDQTA